MNSAFISVLTPFLRYNIIININHPLFSCFLNNGMVKYSLLILRGPEILSQEVKSLPNIKSAIKRVGVTKTKTLKNTIRKSALKTAIKKCHEAINANDQSAVEVYKHTEKLIDKAAAKRLIHKNTAARKKSKLAKALNAAAASK
jgi:small subunit ribosomal protein S20